MLGKTSESNCAYRAGEGIAILYSKLDRSAIWSVSGTMAALGQTRMHSPQSMQRSASLTARPLRTLTAAVGQARMHDMHPSQRSTSKRSEW